ncbi:hypothetical protein [Marinoscillum sp. MHG1-6]|uniref:hypothetical protein n=1 Tax=Marinoscillum sp. MHG1-6 TaxID=2959627 RepID=UPI002158249C|nr:hypothetical protein [Marinoscillum sp. MHG1-6]
MDLEQKKAVMLLKSLVFHYHGLDAEETQLLEDAAKKYDAKEQLNWSNDFLAEDYLSAFERSRDFLSKVFLKLDKQERLHQLTEVWEENYVKGYVTEMETSAMIHLSQDWKIQKEFLQHINH